MSEVASEEVVGINADDILDAAPKTAVAKFDPLRAGLNALKEKFEAYVPDVSTKAGEDEARKNRQELVKIRTSAAKVYDQLNAPLLDAQRQARKIRDEITKTAEKYEAPIDAAIKALELQREEERKRRAEAEAARVAAIRDRIAKISSIPVAAVSLGSIEISAVLDDLGNLEVGEDKFAEFAEEARSLVIDVAGKLKVMQDAAIARENEASRLAAERAELDRLRAEQAERDRIAAEQRASEEAEAAAKLKREQDELAAQRAAFQAEQDAAEARAREALEVAERLEQERLRKDEEQKALLKKQQDAFEEERRALLLRQEEERKAIEEEKAELLRKQRELEEASSQVNEEEVVESATPVEPVDVDDACIVDLLVKAYDWSRQYAVDRIARVDVEKLRGSLSERE